MKILGLSFMYHDSAAALLVDGEVVAAAAEERFSRQKHSLDFPDQAIGACLALAGLEATELDAVVFYEKPLLKFERILSMSTLAFPRGFRVFMESMPLWGRHKLFVRALIAEHVGSDAPIYFADHHYAHAASSFFASGWDRAAILTTDGVGEWATMTTGVGRDNRIELERELRYPHSLGLLYSTATAFLGFRVNGGEGKVMGLASFGEPRFREQLLRDVIDLRPDGSFRLNMKYFEFHRGLVMYSRLWCRAFGAPRAPESEITSRDKDFAASVQAVVEEVLVRVAVGLQQSTGASRLCVAGGVGLNSVANGRILERTGFDELFVQPASGDDGGAIGAALYYYHQVLGQPRSWTMQHAYLGPAIDEDSTRTTLELRQLDHEHFADPTALVDAVARDLAAGKIVGWAQGRMEYGPRALGNRSILASPLHAETKDLLNARVKHRESFRPFAPAVPKERVGDYFTPGVESPFMLLVGRTRAEHRDLLPAVTHIDGTARIQTVTQEQNPLFHALLQRFGELTGVPVLLNTSLNVRGEPIACDHVDAIACYLNTGMDALAVGPFYLHSDD